MVLNKSFSIKLKAFTFKRGLYRGNHLSPSDLNIRNSVLQTLLIRIRLIKECVIYSFTPMYLEPVKALIIMTV